MKGNQDFQPVEDTGNQSVERKSADSAQRLHRLAAVRRKKNVSRRTLADWLKTSVESIQSQERETADLPLSTIHLWAAVLGVPVSELLVEQDSVFTPLLKRTEALRMLHTVRMIQQRSRRVGVQRMAQSLIDQLIEMVPELKDAARRAKKNQPPRAARKGPAVPRPLPSDVFLDRHYSE